MSVTRGPEELSRALSAYLYGITGGGNDSAVYTRYGVNAVALGWPTKYSHSPAEEADTRDVNGLARICTVLAKDW